MYNSLYRGSWCSGMKCGHNWGKTLDCWMQVCLFALHIYVEASNSNSFVTMVMPRAIMWFTVSCLKTIMESWSNFTCGAKQFNWRAVAEKSAAPTKGEMFNTYWRFIKRLNSGLRDQPSPYRSFRKIDCLSDYCGCLITLEDCVWSGVRFNWSLDWLCYRFSLGNDSSCRVGILMLQLFNCTRQSIPKCLTTWANCKY